MQVKELMTKNPMCCEPSTNLQKVAQMMIDCNCGGIPVCNSQDNTLVGFVTDRDIVCRLIAKGINPLEKTAKDVMTTDLKTVNPNSDVEYVIQLMERFQVRRVPVVDENNKIVGIVAQADLARFAEKVPQMKEEVEEVLEKVSEPRSAI